MSDFWVFGYGSLMWNPGFETIARARGRMYGVHRALCVRSYVHRGTPQSPGLVLGLDRGGSCHGVALKIAGERREATIAYLRERELVTQVYLEAWRRVQLENGDRVDALVYLVDRTHEQYAGRLSDEAIGAIVAASQGRSGNNLDYVRSTLRHLREMGIFDPHLEAVEQALRGAGLPSA